MAKGFRPPSSVRWRPLKSRSTRLAGFALSQNRKSCRRRSSGVWDGVFSANIRASCSRLDARLRTAAFAVRDGTRINSSSSCAEHTQSESPDYCLRWDSASQKVIIRTPILAYLRSRGCNGEYLTPKQSPLWSRRQSVAHGGEFKTLEQGAATSIWCATSLQPIGVGGIYCQNVEI